MPYSPQENGARCDICPLKGNTVVPPTPHPSPQFVIVGEGPGRVEEKLGAPFLGQSGQLLDSLLLKNGLRQSNAHITNAALCRGEKDKDNEKAAECCAPRLLRELNNVGQTNDRHSPTLLLGKTAARSVLGVSSILAARGFVWKGREIKEEQIRAARKSKAGALRAATLEARACFHGRPFFPALHPAFVLRADTWKPLIEIDFARFARAVRGEIGALADEAPYTLGLSGLRELGPVVSLDIETDGVRVLETKILSVQISDGERTVILWPWKREYSTRLSRFLASRERVIGHNLFQFDLIVLEKHGVVW